MLGNDENLITPCQVCCLFDWLVSSSENNGQMKLKAKSDMDSVPETLHKNTVQHKRIENYMHDLMIDLLIKGILSHFSVFCLGFIHCFVQFFRHISLSLYWHSYSFHKEGISIIIFQEAISLQVYFYIIDNKPILN